MWTAPGPPRALLHPRCPALARPPTRRAGVSVRTWNPRVVGPSRCPRARRAPGDDQVPSQRRASRGLRGFSWRTFSLGKQSSSPQLCQVQSNQSPLLICLLPWRVVLPTPLQIFSLKKRETRPVPVALYLQGSRGRPGSFPHSPLPTALGVCGDTGPGPGGLLVCDSMGFPLTVLVCRWELAGPERLSSASAAPHLSSLWSFCAKTRVFGPSALGEFLCRVAVSLLQAGLTRELCLGIWGGVKAKGRS